MLHREIQSTLAGLAVYRDPTTQKKWLHIRNEDGNDTHSECNEAVKLEQLLRRVEKHIAGATMLETARLHRERSSTEELTVYSDPATRGKWLHIRNEDETETQLVHFLKRQGKHAEMPKGYLLASPTSVQRIGMHAAFDPYGAPWLTYHEIGAVLHCYNVISLHDYNGGTIQSIHDRLYAQGAAAPPGLAQALTMTQTRNGYTWYTMNTHKAKRQGLLSHCSCCVPASVMRISWERTSSKEHIQQCQETLHAWIGLHFKMLPGDHRSTAKLPCV